MFKYGTGGFYLIVSTVDVELIVKLGTSIYIMILSLLSLLVYKDLSSNNEFSARKKFYPILKIDESNKKLPLVEETLRDPVIEEHSIDNEIYADHLLAEISELEKDLQFAKRLRKQELHKNLYRNFVLLSYYHADIRSGKIPQYKSQYHTYSDLNVIRKRIIQHGLSYANMVKSKRERSTALYHVLTAKYLLGYNKKRINRDLSKLKRNVNPYLKRRIKFLTAIYEIDFGNSKKGVRRLRKIMNTLNRSGRVASRLKIAENLAGINKNGKKIRKTNKTYRLYVKGATSRTLHLTDQQKDKVLSYAIFVWRKAEGRKINWNRSPIYISRFKNTQNFYAIMERGAIYDYTKHGNYKRSIRKYSVISNAYLGSSAMANIDKRIIDIQYQYFKKSKNVLRYHNALSSMKNRYKDISILGNGSEKLAERALSDFKRRHRTLITALLKQSQKKKVNPRFRRQSIKVAYLYLDQLENSHEKIAVKNNLGKVYYNHKEHKNAVKIYSEIVDEVPNNKKRFYIEKAIVSQRVLAKWSSKPPWKGVSKGYTVDRLKLAKFYEMIHNLNGKKVEWSVVAHLGLLKVNTNNGNSAFDLWHNALDRSARGYHAQKAAGLMMFTYHKRKEWQRVEDLARFCMAKRLQPLGGRKALNVRLYLADALFNGGKEAHARKDYKVAIKKLVEFKDSYRRDKRRDNAMFILAYSYRGNAQYATSIEILISLVEQYPATRFRRPALIVGGKWSTELAFEEQVIYFYSRFMQRYENDKKANEIRSSLVDLYLGRELYGNVSRLYKRQIKNSRSSRQAKVNAALRYMTIEERYGDVVNAKWGANEVLRLANGNDAALAQVYGFQARSKGKSITLKTLKGLEKKLDALDSDNQDVVENLAQTRLMIADKGSVKTKDEVFNLGLRDPKAALNKYYGIFISSKKEFDKVCQIGSSSYCAPAMYRLATLTTNTISTIEDITIPETLDDKTVISFNNRKQSIIESLANIAERSNAKAITLVKQGTTTPIYAEQILWSNTENWDHDSISNESKHSFIQWTPDSEEEEGVEL